MLLWNADLLLDDPFSFVVLIVSVAASLLIGITFHEAAHAYTARRLGDATAARLGRITLNPKAHLDPTGTAMLLIAGFGWGKPVPVNPYALGRRGVAVVSAAGPASNLLLALAFAALFQLGVLEAGGYSRAALQSLDVRAWLTIIAHYSVLLNLVLAAFNMLPVHPLDGGGVLAGVVPRALLPAVAWLERFGPILLILVIAAQFVGGLRPLSLLFGPVYSLAGVLLG